MKKNRKGFTLVELLAVIVILGIIMAIAIPNVTGILYRNRSSTYVEDAKKLATTAEYKFRGSNNSIIKPANNQCIVMNLAYLDNSEFEEPPNGGEYLKDQSFVVIKKNGSSYEYYVQLVERITNDTDRRGISLIKSTDLYKENATDLVDNIATNKLFNLSEYGYVYGTDTATNVENSTKGANLNSKIGTSVVDCSGGIAYVYAIE